MYVELYRSKAQFHRKHGGQRRARLFKALIAAAYLPRLAVSTIMAPFVPGLRDSARTYGRLMAELPNM